MAQRIVYRLEDDLDNSEAAETIVFGVDSVSYEIDLSEANAQKLRDLLAPYVAAGRRVGGRRKSPGRGQLCGRDPCVGGRERLQRVGPGPGACRGARGLRPGAQLSTSSISTNERPR